MNNLESNKKDLWDANSYQNNHDFVWKYGANLIEMLSPKSGEHILDLGCGTGQLTDKISAMGARVVGIDNSPRMIVEASQNYPHLEFKVADATNFSISQLFDAVFSNAALHWMKPPETVVSNIWQTLKPGGRLVAEFGGRGNVQSIVAAINAVLQDYNSTTQEFNPWYFPSISQYTSLLEERGFCVTYAELFDRPTLLDDGDRGMSNWLKMFANSFLGNLSIEQQTEIIDRIEQRLSNSLYKDNRWFADYKRLRVVAFK